MLRNPKLAFTLIELSIVLVIIGLLAAGVLVGRDLIRAAEIRRQVSQIEQMDTAVMTFRSKYNCIPGDCPNAEEFDLGVSGGDGQNGDGDGVIDYLTANPADDLEAAHFWHHLGESNLIGGTYASGTNVGINTPSLAMQGKGIYGDERGGFWISSSATFLYPNTAGISNPWLLISAVTGTEIGVYDPTSTYNIDIKIDDGKPTTGKMKAAAGVGNVFLTSNRAMFSIFSTNNLQPAQVFPDACVNDDDPNNPIYNLNNPAANTPSEQSLCILIIKSIL